MLLKLLCIFGIIFLICLILLAILIGFIFIRASVKFDVENDLFDKEFYENKRKIDEANKRIENSVKQRFRNVD